MMQLCLIARQDCMLDGWLRQRVFMMLSKSRKIQKLIYPLYLLVQVQNDPRLNREALRIQGGCFDAN